jgi:hypothetical protein
MTEYSKTGSHEVKQKETASMKAQESVSLKRSN